MTTFPIEQFVSVPRLTTGRRLIALERMAEAPAAAPVLPALDAAIAAHRHALAVADRWRSAMTDHAMHADGARVLDIRVDRALAGFHAVLDGMGDTFEDPVGGVARDLQGELFPQGVGPLTSLPFVDQHAALGALLGRLRASLADPVRTLSLEPWVTRLEVLNTEYGKALTRPERLTWDEVRAADTASYAATVEVVARIIGLFPTNQPADRAGRQALLQPLVDQQQELSRLKSRRKADGGTTEELLGEEAPVEEPPPVEEPSVEEPPPVEEPSVEEPLPEEPPGEEPPGEEPPPAGPAPGPIFV